MCEPDQHIQRLIADIAKWIVVFCEAIGIVTLIIGYWLYTTGFFGWLFKATP
jgi:magnesium-transporting ATPase (P-type)